MKNANVYIVGHHINKDEPIACYWNNKTKRDLAKTKSSARSVYISGSDVYIAGVYWKETSYDFSDGISEAEINKIKDFLKSVYNQTNCSREIKLNFNCKAELDSITIIGNENDNVKEMVITDLYKKDLRGEVFMPYNLFLYLPEEGMSLLGDAIRKNFKFPVIIIKHEDIRYFKSKEEVK